ncbi:MAG: AbrB/MazE/SpoVT family DNA-binding domain-containing protein [Microcoleus sp.]
MMRRKSFRTWLWEQLDSDCPFGDLARDAKQDKDWKGTAASSLRTRMYANNACYEALRTLTEAEKRYKLDEMIAGITPENRHEEIDFGPPVGKEFGASDDD